MKHTTESFIKKAKEHHGDKYDYSKVEYRGTHEKIEVICNECGKSFMVYPCDHIKKGRYVGCPDCTKKHMIEKLSITKEEFIRRAKSIYGDKYDYYSNINFVNMHTKIQVFCNKCKKYFYVIPSRHINKERRECPECSKKILKKRPGGRTGTLKSRETFIKQAIEVHGEEKFDYSEVVYKGRNTKVKIKCLVCGNVFWRTPAQHLHGAECRSCRDKRVGELNRLTTEEFIKRAKEIHGDKFDYSKTKYIDCDTNVEIYCNRCHISFWQKPWSHLRGKYCCPQCTHELGRKPKLTKEKFVEEARKIHGDKYNYDKIIVPERGLSTTTKVEIVCNECKKSFWQDYDSHIKCKHGCPHCNHGGGGRCFSIEDTKKKIKNKFGDRYELIESSFISYGKAASFIDHENDDETIEISPKDLIRRTGTTCNSSLGEKLVKTWLLLNHIKFLERVPIKDLKKKNLPVRIDFIVEYNGEIYWIEYHGQQHFWFVEYLLKTKSNYWKQRIRDQKVRIYCRDHNITLIEIPYTYNIQESISGLLSEIILKGKDPKSLIDIKSYYKK